jgi:hypothetical protein
MPRRVIVAGYVCAFFLLFPLHSVFAQSDIVLTASNVTTVRGNWTVAPDATAAGGQMVASTDHGWSSPDVPLAQPGDYFEVVFDAPAGTDYHLWLRLRASDNTKYNDSVWVQFSDALVGGGAAYPIGSTSGLLVNLENCGGCGVSAWGWQQTSWWLNQPATVTFASSGTHTLRIQVREDGVEFDQIVLSPGTYLNTAPGPVVNDTTIVK